MQNEILFLFVCFLSNENKLLKILARCAYLATKTNINVVV